MPEPETETVVVIEEEVTVLYAESDEEEPEPIEDVDTGEANESEPAHASFIPAPRKRPSLVAPWGKAKIPEPRTPRTSWIRTRARAEPEPKAEPAAPTPPADAEPPKLKLGIKSAGAQNELSLDSAPRGRFEGENPNVFEGEDLDLPPFLRKKK